LIADKVVSSVTAGPCDSGIPSLVCKARPKIYAIIETGGKQYRVTEGQTIAVERLEVEEGATVELDRVLLIGEGDTITVGKPVIEGARVLCVARENGRGEKIIIFKYKAKVRYRRKNGHRQNFTSLDIEKILPPGAEAPKVRATRAKAAPTAAAPAEAPAAEAAAAETAAPAKAPRTRAPKAAAPKAAAPRAAAPRAVKPKAAPKKATAAKPKAATPTAPAKPKPARKAAPRAKKEETTENGA
jgi:large subunit ribosomal protein L21